MSDFGGSDFQLGIKIDDPEPGSAGEFFAELADHTFTSLIDQGIDYGDATDIVSSLLVKLSETFAGEKIYITKQPQVFARWMSAYNDLRTMDYKDVDKKYGWSQGYSLRVQQKIRQLRQHRSQLRLPLEFKE